MYLISTLANQVFLLLYPSLFTRSETPDWVNRKRGRIRHTPPRLKHRLRWRTLRFRQEALRQMNTPRYSKTQTGERERLVPVGVSEMFLCESTFQLKEKFCRCPTNLFFPAIPPFSAQERNFKHLTTAIEDMGRSWS